MTEVDAQRLFWPVVLALAALAFCGVMYASAQWGIGVTADSVYYFEGARNLAAGRGFSTLQGDSPVAITHWPPGYSLVLAALAGICGGVQPAAQALSAVLAALNVILAAVLVSRISDRAWAGMLAALLIGGGVAVFHLHLSAWSEPMCLALVLGCCLVLEEYRRFGRVGWLVLAAPLAAMAMVTRFAAAPFVIAAVLMLLMVPSRPTWRRLTEAAAFGLVAFTPVVLWNLRNAAAGAAGVRRIGAGASLDGADFVDAGHSISTWVLSADTPLAARLVALSIAALPVLAAAAWVLRRGIFGPAHEVAMKTALRLAALFVFGYALMVPVAKSLADPEIVFDSRTLAPLYISAALVVPLAASRWRPASSAPALLLVVLSICVGVIGLVRNATTAADQFERGSGLNSHFWRDSRLVAAAANLPAGTRMYTNQLAAMRYLTPCDVYALPPVMDSRHPGAQARVHPQYAKRMAAVVAALKKTGGAIAVFYHAEWYYEQSADEQQSLISSLPPEDRQQLDEVDTLLRSLKIRRTLHGEDGILIEILQDTTP